MHMPKCGGRSIEALLKQRFSRNFLRINGNHISPSLNAENHVSLNNQYVKSMLFALRPECCIYGHFPAFNLHVFGKKFVFLRNPLDRIISEYYFFKNKGHQNICGSLEDYIKNYPRGIYRRSISNLPPESIDYIGIFEDFEASVERLCHMLGIEAIAPRLNETTYPKNYGKKNYKYMEHYLSEDFDIYESFYVEANKRYR